MSEREPFHTGESIVIDRIPDLIPGDKDHRSVKLTVLEIVSLPAAEEEKLTLVSGIVGRYNTPDCAHVVLLHGEKLAEYPQFANRAEKNMLYVLAEVGTAN